MMSSTTSISRSELLDIFKELQQKFKFSQKQDEIFKNHCQQFQQNISQHLQESVEKIPETNPLFDQIKKFRNILEQTNQNWEKKIAIQNTGVNFRSGFNDSLLVFVYGKVKSGKSSLGNYMAWGYTDPTSQQKNNTPIDLQPHYFSGQKTSVKGGDQTKEAENKREFRVGATEATSSIQGFSLDGLTWIDSPGLHSINQENGDLARDYVEHADLILYTMKSDAPCRESDVKEILELYRSDKKVLLLLTGSDDAEHDYDDEKDEIVSKVVMKSPQRRLDQQKYTYATLEKFPELMGKMDNIDILSFSARYAQEHQDNPKNFADSGMGVLFSTLGKIASAEGVKLKHQVPLKNFKRFLNEFLNDLEKYRELVIEFQQPIERIKKSIPIQINEQKRILEQSLGVKLDSEFEELSKYRNDAVEMNHALKEIANHLIQYQNEAMIAAKEKILKQVVSDLGSQLTVVINNNVLLDLPEFKIDQRAEQITDSINKGTRKRNGGWGALLGGGVGAVAGSIVPIVGTGIGATVGATIGGWLGNKTGDDASANYREITVNVGDNLSQIQQQFSEKMKYSINAQLVEFQKNILEISLNNANILVDALLNEIKLFQDEIDNIVLDIESKLDYLINW